MGIRSWFRAFTTSGQGLIVGLDQTLVETEAGQDPMSLFGKWFDDAKGAGIYLPESMTVATATPDGAPAAREILLKGYDADGFVFYTNYESRKAAELELNPRAALLFHWNSLHRQVRIEGPVTRTTPPESEAYFSSRPRGSRIAAWASEQSAELASRSALEAKFKEREQEFRGREVPLPPFWGGYRVWPERIEFWQGRANRMHDRLLFRRPVDQADWEIVRLSP